MTTKILNKGQKDLLHILSYENHMKNISTISVNTTFLFPRDFVLDIYSNLRLAFLDCSSHVGAFAKYR